MISPPYRQGCERSKRFWQSGLPKDRIRGVRLGMPIGMGKLRPVIGLRQIS
jgi:hypothetical protein